MVNMNERIPNFIKYMGAKNEILDFIIGGISDIHHKGQPICDLFAGSATLSGALRGISEVISNDIQAYSEILAETYLIQYDWDSYPAVESIIERVNNRVSNFHKRFPQFEKSFIYKEDLSLREFNEIEEKQRLLINFEKFSDFDDYYLFTKYYSGTYWNYEQCIWIDSIKFVADSFKDNRPLYLAIMSSLMFAMAYNSQSTGHYAQYRDAKDEKSMNNIQSYRTKNIKDYFIRKFNEIREALCETDLKYRVTTLDYVECLNNLEEGTLVYADPPYGLVHYSRFYHVLETLVRYDYPKVAYKGRYREDRHQSPFCKSREVVSAFHQLFFLVGEKKMELVLSYSDSETNAISFTDLIVQACVDLNNIDNEDQINKIRKILIPYAEDQLVLNELEDIYIDDTVLLTDDQFCEILNQDLLYEIKIKRALHHHSTMGRKEEKKRKVKEILIIAKRL